MISAVSAASSATDKSAVPAEITPISPADCSLLRQTATIPAISKNSASLIFALTALYVFRSALVAKMFCEYSFIASKIATICSNVFPGQ